LTKDQDKFAAFAGAIKDFESVLGRNVAGLWTTHLMKELLWAANGKSVHPVQYRVPAWSWGSLDGELEIPYLSFDSDRIVARRDGGEIDLIAQAISMPDGATWSLVSSEPKSRALGISGQLINVKLDHNPPLGSQFSDTVIIEVNKHQSISTTSVQYRIGAVSTISLKARISTRAPFIVFLYTVKFPIFSRILKLSV
jgi:hypothetical protein